MPMALALTTTSSAPALTVATAVALNSTVASSLLLAPTSSISLTPGPSSDPVVSNDSPSDDTAPLEADPSAVGAASSSSASSVAGEVGSPSRSPSKGPSRSAASAPSSSSSPSQQAGQKTAAQSSSSSDSNAQDLLPSSEPEQGQCFGAAGTGSITTACCASLKGALASGAAYCLFEAKNAQTWETCVSTATDGNKAQLAVKCSGSRRNRATWAVIALGVGIALMGSA